MDTKTPAAQPKEPAGRKPLNEQTEVEIIDDWVARASQATEADLRAQMKKSS